MGPDLNIPDEGLLGGQLKRRARSFEKGNYRQEALKVKLERIKLQLDIDRQTWRPNWIDLANNFRPYRGRWLIDSYDTNKGWRRNWSIVDSTPIHCINTLASGMQAGVASPTRPWFTYTIEDDYVLGAPGVKEWLDYATKKARAILGHSNFYNAAFEGYGEFGTFGVMAIGREWPWHAELPHFYPYTIGSYFVGQNQQRRINTFFRDFQWTVQQIVEKWVAPLGRLDDIASWRNVSARTRQLWLNEQYHVWVQLTHAVVENQDRQIGLDGNYLWSAKGMPFRSVYYERGGEPDLILFDSANRKIEIKGNKAGDVTTHLGESGFRSFPVWCPRWYTNAEDVWGRGPAMDALGDARALQLQQKRKAQSIDRLVDPPMRAHPSLRNQRTSMLPGDTTYVAPEPGQVGFEPVYIIKPEVQALLEDIKETQERIKWVTYSDIFAMFIQEEKTGEAITAAEVNARQQEKLLMLGPMLEQINFEFLNPLHEWLMTEMERRGMVPKRPAAMRKSKAQVKYSSILANAINAVTFSNIQQFTGFLGEVAKLTESGAQNPALDAANFDNMVSEAAKATGVPPTLVRSQSEIEKIRAHRQQMQEAAAKQQAMQQRADTLAQHAKAAQTASQTPAIGGGEGSMLDQLAGAAGASPVAGK